MSRKANDTAPEAEWRDIADRIQNENKAESEQTERSTAIYAGLHRIGDRVQGESEKESEVQEWETASKQEVLQQLRTENKLRKENLKSQKQDRQQRKKFALIIFHFLCVYLAFVFVILFFSGFSVIPFTLSDGVLITLLSTTTVNMIGIFILVVKYLFPAKD